MNDGEQEPDSEVETDDVKAAEQRYDNVSSENKEAAWLEFWHARDFTWSGKSEKFALKTEMVEVPASFPDGREAEGEFKTVTLQNYWRWSIGLGGEERLLTDEEMREAGLLVEVDGEAYHLIHAPDMGLKTDEHGKPLQILTDIVTARGKRVPDDIGTDAYGRSNWARGLQLWGGWLPGELLRHIGSETAATMSIARVSDIDLSGLRTGPLECARSLFVGKGNFISATFGGETSFTRTTFVGSANFETGTFSSSANFRAATFRGGASFGGAAFNGKADFGRTIFDDHATFGGATFSGETRFARATFSRSAVFETGTFSGEANFGGAIFSGPASFGGTTFTCEARFISAAFENANFGGATFFSLARFGGASFSREARFVHATFTGEARFVSAIFSGSANFRNATFTGEARFEEASFRSEANFEGATFLGKAEYERAMFAENLTFQRATLEGLGNFRNVNWTSGNCANAFKSARFKDRVNFESYIAIPVNAFNEAHFAIPPNFTDLTQRQLDEVFGNAISLTAKSIRWAKKEIAEAKRNGQEYRGVTPDQLLAALEGSFRTLKKVAEEKGNFLLSQTYYRFEVRTRVKRPKIAFWEKVAARLYGLSSDYGSSIARPFVSLAVILVGFAAIYLALAIEVNLVDWQDRVALQSGLFQSIDFSLANVFRPLSALSTDTLGEEEARRLSVKLLRHSGEAFGLIVTAISIVQSLTGIVLAFLFGLAVRRRFQIS